MADDRNTLAPQQETQQRIAPGDVPEALRRRYLTDDRGGPGLGFYLDARAETAAFRDQGRRLTTDRNDPNVVRDLVAVAQHRGWTVLAVRGHAEFRREVWRRARAVGVETRGYRPTGRDRQQSDREIAAGRRAREQTVDAATRLQVVETVVRNRVVEPAEQSRILAAARDRLARWLDRVPHDRARG